MLMLASKYIRNCPVYCSWEPLPNLRSALVGYDLPTGNPYASSFIEDPGLKKQIFNATMYSA